MHCRGGACRGWKWEEEMVTARESQRSFQRKSPCVSCPPKADRKVTDRKMSPDTSRGFKCYRGNMSVVVEHGGGVIATL